MSVLYWNSGGDGKKMLMAETGQIVLVPKAGILINFTVSLV